MDDTCASSHLNHATTHLVSAQLKLQDEQTRLEIEETLKKLRKWSRQAGIEELAQRDREDGIA